MDEYDIYLNGVGYMLAKDAQGVPQSGASRESRVDPFSHHLSQGERWKRQTYRFGEGAGAAEVDGSHRYRRGWRADSRSGRLLRGPRLHVTQQETDLVFRPTAATTINDEDLSTGGTHRGLGIQFTVPAGKTSLRSVALLVKRKATRDYGTAAVAVLELRQDAAGTPGAVVATVNFALKGDYSTWPTRFGVDAWKGEEYHYRLLSFSAAAAVVAGNSYWLCVTNNQAPELYWGRDDGETSKVSTYNGAVWAAGADGDRPLCKVNFTDEVDAPAKAFCEFRGSDDEERLYAAVGPKVMYWNRTGEAWTISKSDFVGDVTDLLVFDQKLFAAQGVGNDIYYSTGSSGAGAWNQVAGHQAICFALHDTMIWKADGADVKGSTTGTAWAANAVTVGDPGTIVSAMVSHGARLYCAKEEGIYEVSYPDTYPGTGTPAANLVLDFSTDKTGRPWVLDWHGGLYFAGTGGLYEWKNGVLRDIWSRRMETEETLEVAREGEPFTQPARPVPVSTTEERGMGVWRAATGTTRGLAAAVSSPHLGKDGVWWYDGRNWHPVWQVPDYLSEYVEAIHLESYGAGRGRLWFGLGHDIAYVYLPTWTNDRSMDAESEYDTEDTIVELPLFDDGQPHMAKDFYAVAVLQKNPSAANGRTRVYYLLDHEANTDPDPTTWTEMGLFTGTYHQIRFPVGDVHGRSMRLLLVLEATGTGATVEVESVELLFQPLPETVIQHQVTIRAARSLGRRTGAPDTRRAGEILATLFALQDEAEPIEYIDELGETYDVRVGGVSKVYSRIEGKPGEPAVVEAGVVVSMFVVTSQYQRAAP